MPAKFPTLSAADLDALRVDFRTDDFRRLLLQRGMRIKWESATLCPCSRKITHNGTSEDTNEPRVDCASCGGSGVIYFNSQPIVALAISPSEDPALRNLYGEHAHGMIRLTLLPEHMPGVLDRFTLLDSSFVWHEHVTRDTGSGPSPSYVDHLRYPVYVRPIKVGSFFDPASVVTKNVGVIHVRKANAAGETLSGELKENVDFVVTDDGEIDWTIGTTSRPSHGTRYSVRYFAHPVYVARAFPYTHRDQFAFADSADLEFQPMVVRVDCWLEHLGSVGAPYA